MNRTVKIISIVLLVFLGISALFGGGLLIADPSGGLMEMPLSFLEHSPFGSFLIPGLTLFLFNGVSSIIIAVFAIRNSKYSPVLILLQGVVQIIWIVVQIISIRQTSYLQLIYGSIGLILLVLGLYAMTQKNISSR